MEGLPLSFDPKIFVFSLVNFAILFFILKKFLFAPLYDILEKRKTKIKESLGQVKKIEKEREIIGAEKEDIITKAGQESQKIIQQAEKMKKEILNHGREEADRIIKNSRVSIEKEREELKAEMNNMLMDLVFTATSRALSNLSKEDGQNKLIEKAILQSLQKSSADVESKKGD